MLNVVFFNQELMTPQATSALLNKRAHQKVNLSTTASSSIDLLINSVSGSVQNTLYNIDRSPLHLMRAYVA